MDEFTDPNLSNVALDYSALEKLMFHVYNIKRPNYAFRCSIIAYAHTAQNFVCIYLLAEIKFDVGKTKVTNLI